MIGTDIDGIRDVVIDGVNGCLVPVDDHAAMARRILELVAHPADYREMSKLGPAVAARRIDIDRFAERIECYYTTGELPAIGVVREPEAVAASGPDAHLAGRPREVAS